jgi:hypothetical protein
VSWSSRIAVVNMSRRRSRPATARVCDDRPVATGSSRLGFGLLVVVATLVLTAAPAAADPAKPTNYASTVTRLDPSVDGVRVDVVGGDAFLRIRVARGHEVIVHGYEDEPYLRVRADGTVEQNVRSPAVLLNTNRYASVGPQPGDVDPAAEPKWERVAGGGEYVWHDHRSHWMGKAVPPQLGGDESGVVFDDWQVPMQVDGAAVTVHGRLVRDAPPSALPWLGLALLVTVAGALVARRTDRLTASAVLLALASAAAVAVSATGQYGLPSAAGRQQHLVWVPVIALVAAIAAVILRKTPYGPALVAGAALTLPLWIFGVYGVLTHAHAPTSVAEPLQRAVVALAIAAVAVAAVAALDARRGPRVLTSDRR